MTSMLVNTQNLGLLHDEYIRQPLLTGYEIVKTSIKKFTTEHYNLNIQLFSWRIGLSSPQNSTCYFFKDTWYIKYILNYFIFLTQIKYFYYMRKIIFHLEQVQSGYLTIY